MSAFFSRLVSLAEAEGEKEEILRQMPPGVRARTASCLRKDKAFQIAAAEYYARRSAEEEGLGPAGEIRVEHDAGGKPYLVSGGQKLKKNISLSHSDAYIMICMADDPVGCDVERIRTLPLNGGLKGFFSPEDLEAIRAAGPGDELLTRIWTRREAFAKLTGIMEGLSRRSFHDREAAREAYGVVFTEGREGEYLFTSARFEGKARPVSAGEETEDSKRGEGE